MDTSAQALLSERARHASELVVALASQLLDRLGQNEVSLESQSDQMGHLGSPTAAASAASGRAPPTPQAPMIQMDVGPGFEAWRASMPRHAELSSSAGHSSSSAGGQAGTTAACIVERRASIGDSHSGRPGSSASPRVDEESPAQPQGDSRRPESERPKPRTTLMIRNLPSRYTQEELVQEWPNAGEYDYLYLPRGGERNLSYAFMNFVSPAHAQAFVERWNRQWLSRHLSTEPLDISYADIQGFDDNLQDLLMKKQRSRRMRLRGCEPMIFIDGIQMPYKEVLSILCEGGTAVEVVAIARSQRLDAGRA